MTGDGKRYYYKYSYTHCGHETFGKTSVWAYSKKQALLLAVADIDEDANNIRIVQIDEVEYNSGWKAIADCI